MAKFVSLTKMPGEGNKPDHLAINYSEGTAKGLLRVFEFQDHGHHVAYIPTLNLSSYGDTPEEASERLWSVVIPDFFAHLTELSQDDGTKELKKLGWFRNKFFHKRFQAGSYVDKDGILKNFNLPKETEVRERAVLV